MFRSIFTITLFVAGTAWGAVADDSVAKYTKLRFDYANAKDFSPGWESEDGRTAITDAFKKSEYGKVEELGEAWLKKVPVDAEAHLVVALAYKAQGDLVQYCQHMGSFYGLLQSITSDGDGRSAKTAFKVISVSEEYYLLRDIGARIKKQSLVGQCDVMVVDQRGKEMTYYFDVSISLAALRRELEGK